MRTTIDRFGRVVVPKELRDRFGFQPGTEIEIDEHDREIVLKQADQVSPLQDEDGVLVFAGKAIGDISSGILAQREKRLQKFSSGLI
ncbi:MAG: AbrB/MazE/SpoVT family DNA-binding domain-containing protein [Nitrospirae bacterium]|nr:AbrB/MazE/SpoVT family DNA-binding domain-containing protein [Nitrospirota bacterium]